MKEQLTITTARASKLDFKSEKLTQLTISLDAVYQEAAEMGRTANRRIACILSEIESTKCYTEDGYKSVADYAKEVFGIERSNAYQLATAGDVYNDFDTIVKSGETPSDAYRVLADMSPSKLAETISAGRDKAIEALENGEISADSTQKELRTWAKAAKASETQTGTVAKEYTAHILVNTVSPDLSNICGIQEDIEEQIKGICESKGYTAIEIVKLTKGFSHAFALDSREKGKLKVSMPRYCLIAEKQGSPSDPITTNTVIYTLSEAKPETPKKQPKPAKALTDAQIAKALGVDVETVKKLRAGNAV